ncbi:MAG: hypothetical protein ABH951_02800 [Patescibacteria group bacterium]
MKKVRINIDEKYKKYLPSKKFSYLLLSFVGLGIIIFLVSTLLFGKSNFMSDKKKANLSAQKMTISELLQKDSDGDGVMNWEEGLWGTDPYNTMTFDGIPDKEYIGARREALKTPGGSGSSEELNETTKFAQQFFASLAALKQSGNYDEDTIKNMSASLGREITNPMMINIYNSQDLKINPNDSLETQEDYYIKAANLFEIYKEKGIGDELVIVSTIVASGTTDPESENKLSSIADAYQEYAQKMLITPVPESLKSHHLNIINNSNNTGISVKNMAEITGDPIIGLSGVAQYQKYSEDLIKSVGDLEMILSINGIIE